MKTGVKFYQIEFADIEVGAYDLGVSPDGELVVLDKKLKLPMYPNKKGQVRLFQNNESVKNFNITDIYEWVVCIKDHLDEFHDIVYPEKVKKGKYRINEQGQVIYSPKHLQKYGIFIFYKSVSGNSVKLMDKFNDTFKLNTRALVYNNVPKCIEELKNDFVSLEYGDVKKDTYLVNEKGDIFSLNTYNIIKYANESTKSYSLQTEDGRCKSITRNRAKAIYQKIANNKDVWDEVRKRNVKQKYSETYIRNICKLLEEHKGDFKQVLDKEFGITKQTDDAALTRLVRSLANRTTWSKVTKDYNY